MASVCGFHAPGCDLTPSALLSSALTDWQLYMYHSCTVSSWCIWTTAVSGGSCVSARYQSHCMWCRRSVFGVMPAGLATTAPTQPSSVPHCLKARSYWNGRRAVA